LGVSILWSTGVGFSEKDGVSSWCLDSSSPINTCKFMAFSASQGDLSSVLLLVMVIGSCELFDPDSYSSSTSSMTCGVGVNIDLGKSEFKNTGEVLFFLRIPTASSFNFA